MDAHQRRILRRAVQKAEGHIPEPRIMVQPTLPQSETHGRYSTSDKLAIALACLAGIMAIILFLVEKSPTTIRILLALMVALGIHPVLHFVRLPLFRALILGCFVIAITVFGWRIWLKPKSIAQGSTTVRHSPLEHAPTLPELFKSDFSNLLSRERNITWKDGSGPQITAHLYLDFPEKNKFVAFYIPAPLPKPERTYDACIELANLVMSVVSDQSLQIWGGNSNSMSSMNDLKFTGLVYLYHEWPLSNPQKAAIIEAYQAKHFDVEFRGPDYELQVDTRWHLDHDAKPRPAP